ncbi:unnamed protein product [Urochloa humidicola]
MKNRSISMDEKMNEEILWQLGELAESDGGAQATAGHEKAEKTGDHSFPFMGTTTSVYQWTWKFWSGETMRLQPCLLLDMRFDLWTRISRIARSVSPSD